MAPPLPHRPARPSESGVALLVAITAIAVLSALAVDLSYETQVRLRTAANARDELRAAAQAHSAVTFSRLVLSFQAQLDQAMSAGGQALAAATGGTLGAAATALPRPQLWNLVQVDSALAHGLFGDEEGQATAPLPAPAAQAPLAAASWPGGGAPGAGPPRGPDGGFQARIEDEGQKINAQLDALGTSGQLGPQVEELLRLFCDAKWDPLFDRTDADGQRTSRTDLLVNLKDWVDEDSTGSVLTASFPGGNCAFVVPPNPFEGGFSDENFPYDRGQDRYKAKNARMDSLAELNLVAGVSDAFMAAFQDQLTVYLPNASALNVNSDDPRQQLLIAGLMTDPAAQASLLDPKLLEAFHKTLLAVRMGGLLTITPVQFQQVLSGLGVKVRADLNLSSPKSPFTDRSVVFRITALGVAGDVSHRTEAVVSFDPNLAVSTDAAGRAAGTAAPPFGRLIHWHEE
jgi:general secretion pathway protein K